MDLWSPQEQEQHEFPVNRLNECKPVKKQLGLDKFKSSPTCLSQMSLPELGKIR